MCGCANEGLTAGDCFSNQPIHLRRHNPHTETRQTYDIVLTTYHVLARDFKTSSTASSSSGGGTKQRTLGSKRKGLLAVPWRRVILDEAHNIRNRASLTVRVCVRHCRVVVGIEVVMLVS